MMRNTSFNRGFGFANLRGEHPQHPHVFANFNSLAITLALTINIPVLITNQTNDLWSTADAHFDDFTNSDDHIVVGVAGHYMIIGALTFRSVGGGGEYRLDLLKNGSLAARWQSESTSSSFLFIMPFLTGSELAVGDELYFEFTNTSSSNDVTIINGSLAIHLIHLT